MQFGIVRTIYANENVNSVFSRKIKYSFINFYVSTIIYIYNIKFIGLIKMIEIRYIFLQLIFVTNDEPNCN